MGNGQYEADHMADYPPYPIAVLQNLKNMKKKKKFSKNGKIAPRQLHKSVRGTDGNSI